MFLRRQLVGERKTTMKLNESRKIALTLGQLKKLISESEEADYVCIPLGLTADEDVAKKVNPDVDGNPSPWSILDDLRGQLSDGKWENSPRMEKFWNYFNLEDVGGELNLKVPTKHIEDYNHYKRGGSLYITNGFLDKYDGLGGDPKKIREWLANHIKMVVQDEVGKAGWKRDNEMRLDYFDIGTTVAMVYAVYDILKARPGRNKNKYFTAFMK